MVWTIVEFGDYTVSSVSVKWQRKEGKKCWYPKTKILWNIKNETEIDKKSKNWVLHSCRPLMNGEKYAAFTLARNAEIIAQNHSTMASFETSQKKKSRKRTKKQYDSSPPSSPEREGRKDFVNLKKMSELDAELDVDRKKVYNFRSDNAPLINESGGHSSSSQDEDSENDEDQFSENDSSSSIANVSGTSHFDESTSEAIGDNSIGPMSEVDENDLNESQPIGNEANGSNVCSIGLESTSEMLSPSSNYDFTDDRRMIRLEKLMLNSCQALDSIMPEIIEIKKQSSDTEQLVQNLISICKDLTVEVFACNEELKKRNGLFTDVLVPDIKIPIKRTAKYAKVECTLEKHKNVDNLTKYLASTINEKSETKFIQTSFKVIFDLKFLAKKVWWKKKSGKVCFKNSNLLHCMKESYKIKFGLVEPRKSDKEIEKLIYKICRNLKDGWRKSKKLKIQQEIDAAAAAAVQRENERKKEKQAEKQKNAIKAAKDKKVVKHAAEEAENEGYEEEVEVVRRKRRAERDDVVECTEKRKKKSSKGKDH